MINYNNIFDNFMKDSKVANAFRDAEKEYGELHNNQNVIDKEENKHILDTEEINSIKNTDKMYSMERNIQKPKKEKETNISIKTDPKLVKENIEPRQINIRQSLIELDKEDPDFLGSLSSMYDYLEPDLTIEDKKELIDLINKHDHLKLFNFLNNKIDVDFDYEIHEEEID